MTEAPPREVTKVLELRGKRGGITLVHVLTCGHWTALRIAIPRKSVACIGCWVDEQLKPP